MSSRVLLLLAAASLAACSAATSSDESFAEGAFQGTVSNLVEMSFDTEVRATSEMEAERLVRAQLYWLVGPFHEVGGDPRLTWAKTTKLRSETDGTPGAPAVVSFNVTLEVAWPKSRDLPLVYELVLPRRLDSSSQSAFFEKYKATCISTSGHDTDWSNAWYDFKPAQPGCMLDANDVLRPIATLKKFQGNTVNTYPEYDRIWQDKKFQAVVVFGRDKVESTTDGDLGARDFRKYVTAMGQIPGLTDVRVKEEEFVDGSKTNVQVTMDATMGEGRTVHIAVFLLAKPSLSTQAFTDRYDPETEDADFVAYAGHAGLGGNIQALQAAGKYKPGQYQVFVYDGCDTFAYVDPTVFDKKRAANGADADPNGTRDFDVVLNALPSPWTSGDPSVFTLTRTLLNDAKPTSFEKILEAFPRSGAPVVIGDEDNRFKP